MIWGGWEKLSLSFFSLSQRGSTFAHSLLPLDPGSLYLGGQTGSWINRSQDRSPRTRKPRQSSGRRFLLVTKDSAACSYPWPAVGHSYCRSSIWQTSGSIFGNRTSNRNKAVEGKQTLCWECLYSLLSKERQRLAMASD